MANPESPWSQFTPEVRKAFEKVCELRVHKRGEMLYRVGGTPENVYNVTSGLVALTYLGASGRECLLRLCKAGYFLSHRAVLAEETYHASAIFLEDSKVYAVTKKDFLAITDRYLAACRVIMKALASELRKAELRVASMSDKDVTARVAESLIYLKSVHPDHKWTRREIADFCGSTTATVIRVMSRFESKKMIEQSGRSIQIRNQDALLQLSNP